MTSKASLWSRASWSKAGPASFTKNRVLVTSHAELVWEEDDQSADASVVQILPSSHFGSSRKVKKTSTRSPTSRDQTDSARREPITSESISISKRRTMFANMSSTARLRRQSRMLMAMKKRRPSTSHPKSKDLSLRRGSAKRVCLRRRRRATTRIPSLKRRSTKSSSLSTSRRRRLPSRLKGRRPSKPRLPRRPQNEVIARLVSVSLSDMSLK